MKLAKAAFDLGIQIAAADPGPMLAFYRDAGLHFDHDLPLGGGRMQSRHTFGNSVIKLNHSRGGVGPAPATGWGPLTLHLPGAAAGTAATAVTTADPEGNGLRLVGAASGKASISVDLRVRDAGASLAFFEALGLERNGATVMVGESCLNVVEDHDAPLDAPFEGPGTRYITLQVERTDAAHAEALAAGAGEGMAPKTLGTIARISFVIEPGGNWIELSQRASIVGSLAP